MVKGRERDGLNAKRQRLGSLLENGMQKANDLIAAQVTNVNSDTKRKEKKSKRLVDLHQVQACHKLRRIFVVTVVVVVVTISIGQIKKNLNENRKFYLEFKWNRRVNEITTTTTTTAFDVRHTQLTHSIHPLFICSFSIFISLRLVVHRSQNAISHSLALLVRFQDFDV